MKESIIVLFFFSFGVLGGRLDLLPADWLGLVHEASNLAVYAMLAAVGMSLGFDSRAWRILRDLKGWVVLVPLMIIVGTFLGGVAAWTMLDMSFRDVMAVAAGFGYYSLSSMLINQLADVSLGSMALISNMVRELVTLLFAPLFARVFGGLGPLSAAGAASDTCLPAIIRTSGEPEHHPWDLLGHGAHHRRPHLRDIHFRMAVTRSNKKRNQPVDASERLAYLYANPTISFYNPIQPESIMPLSIFKRLFICFCFALLTALPAQAEERKTERFLPRSKPRCPPCLPMPRKAKPTPTPRP